MRPPVVCVIEAVTLLGPGHKSLGGRLMRMVIVAACLFTGVVVAGCSSIPGQSMEANEDRDAVTARHTGSPRIEAQLRNQLELADPQTPMEVWVHAQRPLDGRADAYQPLWDKLATVGQVLSARDTSPFSRVLLSPNAIQQVAEWPEVESVSAVTAAEPLQATDLPPFNRADLDKVDRVDAFREQDRLDIRGGRATRLAQALAVSQPDGGRTWADCATEITLVLYEGDQAIASAKTGENCLVQVQGEDGVRIPSQELKELLIELEMNFLPSVPHG